jgi:hypothetical protein
MTDDEGENDATQAEPAGSAPVLSFLFKICI